jgi:hypothetical protein
MEIPKLQSMKELKVDFWITTIQISGLRESRGRVSRHLNSQNREKQEAEKAGSQVLVGGHV